MKFVGFLSGLTAASVWGGMYVVSDVVLKTIPPFTLLAMRLFLGVVSLAGIAWLVSTRNSIQSGGPRRGAQSKDTFQLTRPQLSALMITGVIGYGVSLGFQFVGTSLSTAANGALITSATPAFVALFAVWLLRESLTAFRMAALALATVGVFVVVFDPDSIRLGADVLWGNLALFGAAITWGLYSVLVKRASSQGVSTLAISVLTPIGGLMSILPLTFFELSSAWERVARALTDPTIILGVLFLGIVATAIAMYLWNKAFELLDATAAALMFFAQPVVGALLSAWLLGEVLGVKFFAGGGLILLGVLLVSLPANVKHQDSAG